MNKKIKSILGKTLLNEVDAPMGWEPGMTLLNSNGDVDSYATGYDFTLRTTTYLRQKSQQQKFYEVPPADFMTIEVGEGAFMESITQNLEYGVAGEFEDGVQNVSGHQSEIAEVDVALSPKNYPIISWAKGYKYSVMELKKALASNNWDVVQAKSNVLKKNWDLGIQNIAFLGSKRASTTVPVYGLLNQPEPTVDTAIITGAISTLAADVFAAFVATVLEAYYANSNYTVLPDTFVMPMGDMLGLAAPVSSTFPNVSMGEYLEKAFKQATGNANFKIKGVAYAMKANNVGRIGTYGANRYMLYRNDPEVVRMGIPCQFILTNPGTADNYQWKGVAYGQYTGVQCYRPAEIYYMDYGTGA